ncbi:hypothetical protein Cni_G16651 [Canna indica]|uniref:Secreted protein n=1 Tax=Canna indica TaxID=4628 RepID=A0AAQ3KLB3_9LILI|nr:hypothetical protein Cni_G16651 [Canna indica]
MNTGVLVGMSSLMTLVALMDSWGMMNGPVGCMRKDQYCRDPLPRRGPVRCSRCHPAPRRCRDVPHTSKQNTPPQSQALATAHDADGSARNASAPGHRRAASKPIGTARKVASVRELLSTRGVDVAGKNSLAEKRER